MEQISINDLYEIDKALEHDNYKLKAHKKGKLTYVSNKETLEFALKDYLNNEIKLLKPDYDNCILNVISSIKKYFGFEDKKIKTNEKIDKILEEKKPKHVAILLLDGMGSFMVQNNLTETSYLRRIHQEDMTSLYPSTTACVIPAIESGKEPLETCWTGWQRYVKKLKQNIIMFKNENYHTGEKVDINMKELYPYEDFFKDFPFKTFRLGPKFYPEGTANETFKELCANYLKEIKNCDKSFAYLYWDEPDNTEHVYGSYSLEAKLKTEELSKCVEEMAKDLPEGTLIITTADHGHIDVNPIYLTNFHSITETFENSPSNEGRATFFKIKPFHKLKFKKAFNYYFSEYFILMTGKEFLKQGYLGKNLKNANPQLLPLLGDYVAIAKDQYYFNTNPKVETRLEDPFTPKSHHAGLTINEVLVPLILIEK